VDEADKIYRNKAGKIAALVADIQDCHARGQPVLVGTVTIEGSEELSAHLTKAGIKHSVLNARHHEQEASIIAEAGHKSAVTIATNMAGRGTDIKLGGNIDLLLETAATDVERAKVRAAYENAHHEVMVAGGLRVIGTERHESRRIDNQLRGRSGRQGDAGSSVFYLSLQDDLIKRFAPNLDALMTRLNMPEDEAIQHPWISKSIATAQRKIEALHFDMRKHVLKFDDVLNEQRKVIYDQRHEILHGEDLLETIHSFRADMLDDIAILSFPPNTMPEQWQPALFQENLQRYFNIDAPVEAWLTESDDREEVLERARTLTQQAWDTKLAEFRPEQMQPIMRMVLLQSLDQRWRQHLQALDFLRRGINWRGYAQKDPINEFAKESFVLFHDLLTAIKQDTIGLLSRVQLVEERPADVSASQPATLTPQVAAKDFRGPTPSDFGLAAWEDINPLDPRIPRNAPCPCGSGRRFKQ
jgi:preprotein translocase subunit SecA